MYKIIFYKYTGTWGITKKEWNYFIECSSMLDAVEKWFIYTFKLWKYL